MSTFDFECDCGNPAHEPICYLRKGYVQVTHPDGEVEVRWDQLYIFISDYQAVGAPKVEIMIDPDQARMMMWWFVWKYMPGISHTILAWRRICNFIQF